ncbi:lycopene cyclase domain-containing protein [Rubrivirga sp. IMCC43871]|uniref:lycopene cyclase domain-containing protein n=1 Tax=Rubrivirga sp. IMCC43871 TaxID=3391575 RepID=UPI00398FEEE8
MAPPPALTYLQFHLAFTVPPLFALALLQGRTREPWGPLALLVGIAFAYTTPWDNYLVAREVWTYPPGRVLATVGYVPVEEYAFFVIQTVLTGLWTRLLQARWPALEAPPSDARVRAAGVAGFGALAVLGAVLVALGGHGLYLGLIVAWAFPVLALMWGVGGHLIWARRRLVGWAVVPTTLYLWGADRVAIGLGIWDITDASRTGVELAGLPIEEALFFAVTNLLVVQGLVLLEGPALSEIVGRLVRRRAAA